MVGHAAVPAVLVSQRFLSLLQAPAKTISLTFSIEALGVLRCKAVYYTDVRDETAVKEWEVKLPRTSTFYKLVTGDMQ
jgi:hypothetical protein